MELASGHCRLLDHVRHDALSPRALVPRYLDGTRLRGAKSTAKARKGELLQELRRRWKRKVRRYREVTIRVWLCSPSEGEYT